MAGGDLELLVASDCPQLSLFGMVALCVVSTIGDQMDGGYSEVAAVKLLRNDRLPAGDRAPDEEVPAVLTPPLWPAFVLIGVGRMADFSA